MLPDVAIHGTWVRSLVTDSFGRLCYRIENRLAAGSVEFLVMWEPDPDLGTKTRTASYHETKDLMVRPYKPRPWLRDQEFKVVYYAD